MTDQAVVLAVQTPDTDRHRLQDHLLELARLLDTLGVSVSGMAVQKLARPRPGSYFGTGFLKDAVARFDADLIAVEGRLTAAQARSIEAETGVRCVDRTQVILEIFQQHARTREARVQVELARLKLVRAGLRQTGAGLAQQVGAIGVKGGKGEKQIELDRRAVDRRIARLTRELARIERQRDLTLRGRSGAFTVSLVGYTNAGKSTLLNRLTGEAIPADDRLFVTLDTTSRKWFLGEGHWAVLSDTVGFIRNLPHELVASFRSTFGVARHASLLLHVCDLGHDQLDEQMDIVDGTLRDMGLGERPVIRVFNKADRVPPGVADRYARLYPGGMVVSAATGAGLDRLRQVVRERKERWDAERA